MRRAVWVSCVHLRAQASACGRHASIPDTTGRARNTTRYMVVVSRPPPYIRARGSPDAIHGGVIPVCRCNAEPRLSLSTRTITRRRTMSTITTKDGTQIYYKGLGQRPGRNVLPRLAAERRRVGRPNAVPRPEGLPGGRA